MKECPQTKRSLKTQTLTWTRRGKITGVTHGNGNVLRDIHRGEHNDNLSVILTQSSHVVEYGGLWRSNFQGMRCTKCPQDPFNHIF